MQAAAVLRGSYPGVRIDTSGPHATYIYGTGMTTGKTEAQAAEDFLRDHGAVFGGAMAAGGLETRLLWELPSMDGTFVVLAYRQRIRGRDVDGSDIRVKVRRAPVPHVDYAAARLAGEPMGSEAPIFGPVAAGLLVRAYGGVGGLDVDAAGEVVVLRGDDARPDSWCFRVETQQGKGPLARFRTYYVDTALPRIVRVEDHLSECQPTTGLVAAPGTPAAFPYTPYMGPSTLLAMHLLPGVRVAGTVHDPALTASTGVSFSDGAGRYSLAVGSTGQPVLVRATLEDPGAWYRVFLTFQPLEYLAGSAVVPAGGTLNLVLFNPNQNPAFTEELRVAQADTVVSASRARDFFLRYISDGAPGLASSLGIIPSYPASTGQCGSTSVNPSPKAAAVQAIGAVIAFEGKGPVRWSCGCHSIVAHEFGHVALTMIGFPRTSFPGFDEGYADTFSFMLNDDSVLGRQQNLDGTNLRDDPTSSGVNCQYPIPLHPTQNCDCGAHNAGQLLSGPWVRIIRAFKTHYGDAAGLEEARDLFGRWTLITVGGDDSECHSAWPKTVDEIVAIAKPEQIQMICESFAAHGIVGPWCGP